MLSDHLAVLSDHLAVPVISARRKCSVIGTAYDGVMRWLVERRLTDISSRLKRAREELAVTEEQLLFWRDEADEARIRSLVSETPLADAQLTEVRKTTNGMANAKADLEFRIIELLRMQDELLDQLSSKAKR